MGFLIAQQFVNGLSVGCIYAMVALGMTIIFGVSDVVNFAYGDFLMVGAYVTFFVTAATGILWAGILAAVVVMVIYSLLVERVVFKPQYGRPGLNMVLVGIGLTFIMENAAILLWGTLPNYIVFPISGSLTLPGGITITYARVAVILVLLVLLVVLYLFLNRSKMGRALRATAQNEYSAKLIGINTMLMRTVSFSISGALAAIGGAFAGTLFNVNPTMGSSLLLKGFAIVVFGGLGSIPGAICGGIILGVVESLGSTFFSSGLKDMYAFIVMILILILRPQGLFKKSA